MHGGVSGTIKHGGLTKQAMARRQSIRGLLEEMKHFNNII